VYYAPTNGASNGSVARLMYGDANEGDHRIDEHVGNDRQRRGMCDDQRRFREQQWNQEEA
jgi:hypothetical protein